MLGELTGEQLFTLEKADFEAYCGKEEGTHLDSQIRVQKSLSEVLIYTRFSMVSMFLF